MQSQRNWSLWIAVGLAAAACGVLAAAQVGYLLPWASERLTLTASGLLLLSSVCSACYFAGTRGRRDRTLSTLLEAQNQPAAIIAPNAQLVQVSQSFAALADAPSANLVGQDIREFISTDAWDALVTAATEADFTPADESFTNCCEQPHWVQLHVRPVPLSGPGHLLLTCQDQTEQRHAIEQQRQLANSRQSLLEASHDIVLTLNQTGAITDANPRARLVLGADLVAKHINQLLRGDDIKRMDRALANAARAPGSTALRRLGLQPGHRDQPIHIDARLHRLAGDHDQITLTGSSINHMVTLESKIKANAQRLTRMFQEAPDATFIARSSDGKILEFNERFSALLGYSAEVISSKSEQQLGLWERPADRQQALVDLQKTPVGVHCEARLVRADGQPFDAEISLRKIQIGGDDCTLLTIRDVTTRVVAEAARAESEEKFLNTFENSPDGIAIIRKSDTLIYDINPALVAASGYDRDYFIGKPLLQLDVMADFAEMKNTGPELAAQKGFENMEMSFRTKSGERVPALVSAKEFEMRGEAYLLTIVRDVRELRSAQVRVARSEERFRGAFENAQLAMILIGMDGRIFQSNRFAQDLLTYSAKDLDGMHISRLIPHEDKIGLKDSLTRLIEGEENRVRSERRMLCQNGLEIWTNFQIVLQRDPAGDDSYFIIQAADVTDIKLSQRRMERMAFYDTLTDLANRRLFQDRLQQAIEHCQRSSHLSALLYLDLDQFKRVNDTLGHEAGDGLLREVALRLTECVRTEDTVGRTGGDEFTVLLFDIESAAAAGVVAEKILTSLREPIGVSGHNLVVTTSIGVAIIPSDGRDANVVMKNADLAMYRAKERGRNNYQFFSEDMNTRAILRLRTENELRVGIERGEFILHHQPKYRISDGKIIGVECLVRWNHPTRGLLPPGEFIQIAEETGAIVNLGSWIIEAACKAGKAFSELAQDRFTTAVNISPRQFRDPNLISHIRRCLRNSALPPELLQIEITETMLMHDVEAASTIVARLHELGTYLAIDDFGTGYSSLNYLKKFPIQTVKVDRSFVTDIPHNSDDMAITAAVIAMAHRLNMDVVAEGVETQGQLDFLSANDCEYAQGYLFSKPVEFERIEQLLRAEQAGHRGPVPSQGLRTVDAETPPQPAATATLSKAAANAANVEPPLRANPKR